MLKKLSDVVTFGKYKDQDLTVEQIVDDMRDANYMKWLVDDTDMTDFDDEDKEYIYEAADEQGDDYMSYYDDVDLDGNWGDRD